MYLNNFTFNGNVGADADLREAGGTPVVNFSVANTSPFTKKTTWYKVSLFGKQAEKLQTMLTKGTHVVVVGEHSTSTFGQNNERSSNDVRASSVQLVPRGGDASQAVTVESDTDEEVPF